LSVILQPGYDLITEVLRCLLGLLGLTTVGYSPTSSKGLEPAVRELELLVSKVSSNEILDYPLWVLLSI
jgi:hypothetical protein